MTSLAVVSASYAPDLELFSDLHRSVLEFTPPGTVHHVVVPASDLALFGRFAGPRCSVVTAADLLPGGFLPVPGRNVWVNVRRPFPPVRGWIMQQLLKIEATARLEADVALLADSDVALVRPVTAADLAPGGRPRFYRLPDGVDERLPGHVRWHEVARQLLGLPPAPMPQPDFISAFNTWSPAIVRDLQARVAQVTGRHWATSVASRWKFSEFILYGVFAETAGLATDPVERMRCHSHWDEVPLDTAAAEAFVDAMAVDDLAVMISAKSGTDLAVRRAAVRRAQARAAGAPA